MSSKIRVKKRCEYCKEEFVAKTVHTRYCSHLCNRKHYKENKKKEKISNLKKGKNQKIIPYVDLSKEGVQIKSFLSVKETAILLEMSTKTIYRLIEEGQLNAVNLGIRKTLIRRKDIELLFDESLKQLKDRNKDDFWNKDKCYSINEISELYGMSSRAIANLLQRLSIKTKKTGKYVYVQKTEIDNIFNP